MYDCTKIVLYHCTFSTPIKIKFVARSKVLYIPRRALNLHWAEIKVVYIGISPIKYEATKCVRWQVAETREYRDDIQASGRMSELGVCVISPANCSAFCPSPSISNVLIYRTIHRIGAENCIRESHSGANPLSSFIRKFVLLVRDKNDGPTMIVASKLRENRRKSQDVIN